MPIAHAEAVACLEILVAMMKADGRVDPAEKKSLAAALESFEIGGTSVEALVDGAVDVDASLAKIVSDDARAQAYRSAYFMAHADGRCGAAEGELLARIEAALRPSDAEKAKLAQLFASSGGSGSGGGAKGRAASLLDALGGLFRKRS